MPARATPDDQPPLRFRRIAERHRRAGLGFHPDSPSPGEDCDAGPIRSLCLSAGRAWRQRSAYAQ
jgi:hypothetical protein